MGGITEKFADFVSTVRFSDLPEYVVHEMKRIILDSIGCAILGRLTERGKIAADLASKLGGPSESSIIGVNDKVSCTNAAFANGEAMNALDFDAISQLGRHDVPTLVSGILSLAESADASGKDLILSAAIGFEISGRIKSLAGSMTTGSGNSKIAWPEISSVAEGASFGVAAGGCKVLTLNQEKIANAIGITGYICLPATLRKFIETTPSKMTKYGPAGWGAQAGITAALLAERGYIGDTDLFDGEYGFWKYMGISEGTRNTHILLEDLESLGTQWVAHQISYKQYPCGY